MVFPLKQALTFPVLLYGRIDLCNLHRGCVTIKKSESFRAIRIGGGNTCYVHGNKPRLATIINIKGKLTLGSGVIICDGAVLGVGKNGHLFLDENVFFNASCRVYCENEIYVGRYTRISWESQLFDTNFHYSINRGMIQPKNGKVFIGDHVWVGNRVTIAKNTNLPAYCVVASNSLVNKDFSSCRQETCFGGIPARELTKDYKRLFDFSFEYWLDAYFERGKSDSKDRLYESFLKDKSE